MPGDLYDVAIIGGGPAGSTAATLLARAGRRVVVLERDRFPRFHIGESLLPFSVSAFDRLGVREKFQRAGFMEKFGGEIASACGERTIQFYFEDGFRSQRDRAFQVTRAEFDHLLLEHAAETGAEVREETEVNALQFNDETVQLQVRSRAGEAAEITSRYLIDASGRNSLVGSHFKLKKNYHELQKIAVFAHFDGVWRPEGRDGTLTRMVRSTDRWFWMIPLTAERMSIGVVLDTAVFRAAKSTPEAFLEAAIAAHPEVAGRMKNAQRVTPVYAQGDYSYRNTRLAGDRWLLAGDAAGFIDPVFSSGVFLAVLGGEQCADILDEVLAQPVHAPRLFRGYEKRMHKVMDIYLAFVRSWYTREFAEVFLNPQEFLQLAPAVNAVLAGNTGGSFAIRWRMWLFYFFVWVQRYVPLSPRLTLLPKAEATA